MKNFTAGGAIAVGDPLVYSSAKLIKATGGNDSGKIIALAASTASGDGATVLAVPLTPDVVVKIPIATGDTLAAGTACGLDATTLVLSDDEAAGYYRVYILEVNGDSNAYRNCISLGWPVGFSLATA
jgi:hypothetical protein